MNGQEIDDQRSSTPEIVFLSYRADPDQSLAEALKILIEGTLDPPPRVFVSGVGGLRPSALTFRDQLDDAAKRAVAYVGVITNASKDRAWIHFEAGAAWGRGRMYAPILVDVVPEDLGDTIRAYQATKGDDQDAMRLLLGDLANTVSARVTRAFVPRYRSFRKAIADYRKGETKEDEEHQARADADPVLNAMFSMISGQKLEAMEQFDALENHQDPDVSNHARIARIVSDVTAKGPFKLEALEALPEPVRRCSEYLYWHGYFEPDPHRAIEDLEKYTALMPSRPNVEMALKRLVELKCDVGVADQARAIATKAMMSSDRAMRQHGATAYLETWTSAPLMERLCAAIAGVLARPSNELIRTMCELVQTTKWPDLGLYVANRYASFAEDGASANAEGIALERAGLRSLAYLGYHTAIARGVSVSKVNVASLLRSGPVSAAGLEMLGGHVGAFDAADEGYPHEMRELIERDVSAERKSADVRRTAGKRLFKKLAAVVAEGLRSPQRVPLVGRYRALGAEFVVGSGAGVEAGSVAGRVFNWTFPEASLVWSVEGETTLVLASRPSDVIGVSTTGADDGVPIRWERIVQP